VRKAFSLLLLSAVALIGYVAWHQPSKVLAQYQPTVTMTGLITSTTVTPGTQANGGAMIQQGLGIGYHVLSWVPSGTVSTCTIQPESAGGLGGTFALQTGFSGAAAVAAQTCTSAGTYKWVGPAVNALRLNPTAMTGSGSVAWSYTGYLNTADVVSHIYQSADPGVAPMTLFAAATPTDNVLNIFNSAGTLQYAIGPSFTPVKVGGLTVVGNGTSSEVYNTASAATTATISATTMVTPAVATTYRFSAYVTQTVVGASCAGNDTIQLALVYQDPNAAGTQTVNSALYTITTNGTIGNIPWTSGREVVTFRSKASVAVQYQATYTPNGSCSPNPTYQVFPVLEVL